MVDREVIGRAAIADGVEIPPIDDATRAMLVFTGSTAKFVLNYWLLQRKGASAHVRVGASFDEWKQALNELVIKSASTKGDKPNAPFG